MKLFDIFKTKPKEKEYTPEEMLEKKYSELIKSNGMSGTSQRIYGYEPIKLYGSPIKQFNVTGKIIGTDINIDGTISIGRNSYEDSVSESCIGILSKTKYSDEIVRKLYIEIIEQEDKRRNEIEIENSIRLKEIEDIRIREQDNRYIEEYKRISGMGNEFSPVFRTLDEIQSIGKKQEQLLNEWKKNTDKIYSLRESIYK